MEKNESRKRTEARSDLILNEGSGWLCRKGNVWVKISAGWEGLPGDAFGEGFWKLRSKTCRGGGSCLRCWGQVRPRGAPGETPKRCSPQVTLSQASRSNGERVMRTEGCERYQGYMWAPQRAQPPSSRIQRDFETQPSFLIKKWHSGVATHSPATKSPVADLLKVHCFWPHGRMAGPWLGPPGALPPIKDIITQASCFHSFHNICWAAMVVDHARTSWYHLAHL